MTRGFLELHVISGGLPAFKAGQGNVRALPLARLHSITAIDAGIKESLASVTDALLPFGGKSNSGSLGISAGEIGISIG